ncbi:hypothetical protein [Photobacterium carnosum]|uniref:hypothetical protein n=1 Tax=Photobacterium carnosum TaxID=2023717 RepID=UPI0024315AEC|nr:hypothetical protein [Photobacterium carnosum]
MKKIGIICLILLSGCASTKSPENWTFSENVNHFEKSMFIESTYFDDKDESNSIFTISCDKGGENEIFAKFIAVKDENYLLFPDIGPAKFDFVIDDILDVSTLGFFTYDADGRVFLGMSNILPKQLLNAMASPLMSEKQLHIRMTVKGIHLKTLEKALASDTELGSKIIQTNPDGSVLNWVKQNTVSKGIRHSFVKHVNLKGFGKFIENYKGCRILTR